MNNSPEAIEIPGFHPESLEKNIQLILLAP